MEEIDPRHLLIKVAEILERLDIPYAVTGGMAVFVWARPRFTADIDIVVLLKPENILVLADVLRNLSEASYIDTNMMRYALERHGEFNFIDGATGVKVDFWALAAGQFEESQLRRRIAKELLGHTVYFVSPEDLILSKLRWHREGESAKQREDIESILKMQKNLDRGYVDKWSKIHGTNEILKELWEKIKAS